MKTVLIAGTLALALTMPTGAQEPMTYTRLCGATEGTGDNNDFCALWAQNNWQGMRNALSISIRTARAAENRNRFYFNHKRGSERGAFIQLKRPWMGTDWRVLQEDDWDAFGCDMATNCSKQTLIRLFRDSDGEADPLEATLSWEWEDRYNAEWHGLDGGRDYDTLGQFSYASFLMGALYQDPDNRQELDDVVPECAMGGLPRPCLIHSVDERTYFYSAEGLRVLVECSLDEFGREIGEVEERPVATVHGQSYFCDEALAVLLSNGESSASNLRAFGVQAR